MEIDLIIGSGGVLSHAPGPAQTAAMLIDAFLPQGVTRLAKDSIFMMPHLGALLDVVPEAATQVFSRDCLEGLCTCVARVGKASQGSACLSYALARQNEPPETGELAWGEIKVIALKKGSRAELNIEPKRRFDVGAGKGKRWRGTVEGGPVGIVLDGRGRPLSWSYKAEGRRREIAAWLEIMGAINAGGAR